MTNEQVNHLLEKAILDVISAGVKPGKHINSVVKINNCRTSFGQCVNNDNGYFDIEISKHHLPHGEEAVYRTLVHEVLHTVKGSVGHGAKWQSDAKKVGDYLGFTISRCETSKTLSLPKEIKHQVSCPLCGITFQRSRESNLTLHPEQYYCPNCTKKEGYKVRLKRDF